MSNMSMRADLDLSDIVFADPLGILHRATRTFERSSYTGVQQWAEAERYLSSETSARDGKYRASYTPWIPEIQAVCTDPAVEMIVCQKSAQAAWTDGGINNFIGYMICVDPAASMILFPTGSLAKRWSRRKFATMIRDTPALRDKIKRKPSNSADESVGSTLISKSFPRGFLELIGSNSAAELRDIPIKNLVVEEPDACAMNASDEGPSIDLAIQRTKTYADRKILIGGSPTIQGESQIEAFMLGSDQRKFLVPCRHCKHEQELVWKQVVWDVKKGRNHPLYGDAYPETARYKCIECGHLWSNTEKNRQVKKGRWQATEEFTGTAGFYISEMMVPFHASRMASLARRYLAAQKKEREGDTRKMKVFVNTALGQTWKETLGKEIEKEQIESRRENLRGTFPVAVQYLTCGVDVQKNRMELEVVGWGAEGESWGLLYAVIPHSPETKECWEELAQYLEQDFTRADGAAMRIAVMAVDSGNWTTHVYNFVKKHQSRGIFAIKGVGGPGRPYFEKSRRTKTRRIDLMVLGVDGLKDLVAERIAKADPGPGYMHVSHDYPQTWEEGMRAEQRVRKISRGQAYHVWIQVGGQANEPWDCRVYATAATFFGTRFIRDAIAGIRIPSAALPQVAPPPQAAPPPRTGGFAQQNGAGSWFNR